MATLGTLTKIFLLPLDLETDDANCDEWTEFPDEVLGAAGVLSGKAFPMRQFKINQCQQTF